MSMSEPDATVALTRENAKALLDLILSTMDYSSGFFDQDETDLIVDLANLCEVALHPQAEKLEPHLWHQDCRLTCGKPAGHPVHRLELPAVSYNVCLTIDTGGSQPVVIPDTEFSITSNLRPMMLAVGLDLRSMDGRLAGDLQKVIDDVVLGLNTDVERLGPLNPANGFGNYAELVERVEALQQHINDHPKATVSVSW